MNRREFARLALVGLGIQAVPLIAGERDLIGELFCQLCECEETHSFHHFIPFDKPHEQRS